MRSRETNCWYARMLWLVRERVRASTLLLRPNQLRLSAFQAQPLPPQRRTFAAPESLNFVEIPIVWMYRHKIGLMSAADFLFTPSVQRVLTATLLQPARSYTLQELLALAASGRGNTQLQIEKLLTEGVLKEEPRRGRQRSIKANTAHFLFPELSSILRKTFGLAEPLKAALHPFIANIEEAFVFGSVAKGSDTERSDIDLIVVGTVYLPEVTEALHKLEQDLGRAVHLSLYESQEWSELVERDPVVKQISVGPRIQLVPDAQSR